MITLLRKGWFDPTKVRSTALIFSMLQIQPLKPLIKGDRYTVYRFTYQANTGELNVCLVYGGLQVQLTQNSMAMAGRASSHKSLLCSNRVSLLTKGSEL